MAEKELDVYLNDHLGGATMGADLAKQIRDRSEGEPLGEVMTGIAAEIDNDREMLLNLMELLGVSKNPVKQATGWLAEKAGRVKFSGAGSGAPDQGLLMALESIRLGVAGKKCLWLALREVRGAYRALGEVDFDALIVRAAAQEDALEAERMAVASRALAVPSAGASP